ncbi:MAG: Chromosome partition protein Smc [Candidatus Celerinatantimonas neptuna]|nr:MAG: Chromosome partition protein Smc [Candidatus Celerinatantimonas neptuna]
MRLKSIRLAGFKSFVEPTKIPFPCQLTGVVGPNGCGKSNVIDAVRWVLGESSARNLRGDAMTDVIFNGSTRRAQVSKASVELTFDNQSGRLGGEFGSYNEVAVRREVTRDGQNLYFLNSSRCRKKDITDLFLGTGLGPRSYAIIEQGMISRLIESKPQELRVFIDEAAGVSKYKERRRETENRIRHTQENLQRLTDIESELTAQVNKLRIQAQAALRFRQLRERQRDLKRQQSLFQLQQLDQSLDVKNSDQNEQSRQLELINAKLTELEDKQFLVVEQQNELSEQLDRFRQDEASRAGELARYEQRLIYQQQTLSARKERQDHYQQQLILLDKKIQERQKERPALEAQFDHAQMDISIADQQLETLSDSLIQLDDKRQVHSEHLQKQTKQVQQSQQQLAAMNEQVRSALQLNEQSQRRLSELKIQLDNQVELPDLTELEYTFNKICNQLSEHLQFCHEAESEQEQRLCQLKQIQQSEQQLQKRQFEVTTKRQSLIQLIDSISVQQYPANQPLRDQLVITPGWELAVEKVLGPWLFAETDPLLCIDADFALWGDDTHLVVTEKDNKKAFLAEKVSGVPAFLFSGIFCAENREEALVFRPQLALDESVITMQGDWFGSSWQDCLQKEDSQSVLAIQRQLGVLNDQLPMIDSEVDLIKQQITQSELSYQQADRELRQSRDLLQVYRDKQAKAEQQLALARQQQEHQQELIRDLTTQLHSAQQEVLHTDERQQLLTEQQEQLQWQLEVQQDALLEAEQKQQNSQQCYQQQYLQIQQIERKQHQDQLRYQQLEGELQQFDNWFRERQQQTNELHSQLDALREEMIDEDELEQLQAKTDQLRYQQLERQQQREQLEEKRNQLNQQNTQLSLDVKAQLFEKDQHQQSQQQQQLAVQELLTRRRVLLEQLAESGIELAPESFDSIDPDTNYEDELGKIERQLKRLGAVNLAAEQEYQEQRERLEELSTQMVDLQDALEMLQQAIAKIDRQTRSKFRETFDKVNTDLQYLFPQVFGGGTAWLELTEDDLLSTGVTIMARPPGKKNSTISLLSGGEKALTALSLVFAIFRLNPAPFCMLDEVDAPLDEVNVGRFADLIARMSETVQFIFISHNRVTMEKADQLAGVTMQEPGVSRLVAVDIAQAVALAE